MPTLTRQRDPHRTDCWLIYFGDVHAGTIVKSVGNPGAEPRWQWTCGFYPGSRPGECRAGSAGSFDQARDDFLTAWRVFLSKRTDADFAAWREERDWTERKYAAWARGERVLS